MPRVFDIEGHPWADGGRQAFRLTTLIQDLGPDDILRLTDRATGHKSYWRVAAPSDTGSIECVEDVWRGVLAQTDWEG
ncbi:MAG TPA: hypothetical protein VF474_13465 [Phenylobacterium sp.]